MLWDKYEVVSFSVDQLIVKTSDHFPSGYVCEGSHLIFHGGAIFWDTETGIIWIENHVSLGAGETEMVNICFEE